jgi:uncharacterized protein YecE (DUF72 family)
VIHIGTSGWQYDSWKGRFYPETLPKTRWLDEYVRRFPVVEVNNTFYHLPKEATFDRWRDAVPDGFVWVVKASRYITHIRRLRNARDSVALFWSRASRLGPKLGPILYQLPPNFRADLPILEEFLLLLPAASRSAFEFRDASWETDEVYRALDAAGVAWVVPDRPGQQAPVLVTGGWSYLRFHQGALTHPAYGRRKLEGWADRIAELPAKDVFVFFNNDPLAAAPSDALLLSELLEERGLDVARPVFAQPGDLDMR